MFCYEKNIYFLKIVKEGKYAAECVSNDIISYKNVFSTLIGKFRGEKSESFYILEN